MYYVTVLVISLSLLPTNGTLFLLLMLKFGVSTMICVSVDCWGRGYRKLIVASDCASTWWKALDSATLFLNSFLMPWLVFHFCSQKNDYSVNLKTTTINEPYIYMSQTYATEKVKLFLISK